MAPDERKRALKLIVVTALRQQQADDGNVLFVHVRQGTAERLLKIIPRRGLAFRLAHGVGAGLVAGDADAVVGGNAADGPEQPRLMLGARGRHDRPGGELAQRFHPGKGGGVDLLGRHCCFGRGFICRLRLRDGFGGRIGCGRIVAAAGGDGGQQGSRNVLAVAADRA